MKTKSKIVIRIVSLLATIGLGLLVWVQQPAPVTIAVTGQSGLNYGPKFDTATNFNAGFSPATGFLICKAPPLTSAWAWGPSSDHSGGIVLHGWADAHVTGITDDTDATLYIQLCTRAGREAATDPNAQGG